MDDLVKGYLMQLHSTINEEGECTSICSRCLYTVMDLESHLSICKGHDKDLRKYAREVLKSLPEELIFEVML